MTELKPCPFCGGEAVYEARFCNMKCVPNEDEGIYHFVACKNRCINSLWVRGTSKEEAFTKWNTRPSDWHTGIPTDKNGLFLIQTKGKNLFIVKWQNGFWDDINGDDCLEDGEIVKWQKIEEGEVNG